MRTECIDRAYELARSGKYDSVMAIAKQLVAEGYKTIHDIVGGALTQPLGATIRTARCGPVPVLKPHTKTVAREEAPVVRHEPLKLLKAG